MLDAGAVDALLFDLDGTLLDSDDQATERLARKLARLGIRNPGSTARRLVMALETPGNAFLTLLDVLGLDGVLAGFAERLHRMRGLRAPCDFQMIPGSREALEALSAHYRLAVVTTRGRGDATSFLERFGLTELFEAVVTRETTWRLKPHPSPILHAARVLGVAPERCAMVGDTTVDVRAARRAGAWAVAVLCGFGEVEELERAGAHWILGSPAEIPSLLASPSTP